MIEPLIAFASSLLLMPAVLHGLRRLEVLDRPSSRSSHEQPVPRGGGVAPAAAALFALALSEAFAPPGRFALVAASAGFCLIGLADDLRSLPPLRRLALQATVALVTLPWLLAGFLGATPWRLLFALGVFLWLVGYVNAFNFMDGINGLSVAQVAIAGAAWFAIGRLEHAPHLAAGALIVLAAALAFAPFNFPSARLFLGDAGSYFFGGWLAVLLVLGLRSRIPPEAIVAPISVYLADTASTLIRRIRRGEAWHQPHRDHAYQRLTRLGWSQPRTCLTVAVFMALSALVGALSLVDSLALRLLANGALIAVLATYLLTPRFVAAARASVHG